MARVLNPFYYIEHFLPTIKRYFEAFIRIVKAFIPDNCNFNVGFIKGFFSEWYGYVTMALVLICICIYVYLSYQYELTEEEGNIVVAVVGLGFHCGMQYASYVETGRFSILF
jgi:uncharacterized membrane protein YdbT with pleckstrin-like domain